MVKTALISVFSLGLAMGFAAEAKAKKPNIAEGKKTFQTYCAACHGAAGKGDGAAAAALNPKPRNFTDTALISKEPKARMHNVIAEGGQKNGLSPMMASWKKTLKPEQIDNVLAYVLTFSEDSTKAIKDVMEKDKVKDKDGAKTK